jgi:pimeloyl-ACP methyl ester carboxylesterase
VEGLSVTQQSKALRAWIDTLGLPPAVFVGHSLSCQTIMQLAAEGPERVAGLVLAAPTGEPVSNRLRHQALGLILDIPRESVRLAVEVATAYLLAGPRRIWHTWNLGAQHDPLHLLPEISAPGIVVIGTRDPVVPHPFARTLAEGLGRDEPVWIEGAAHALIFTHAEEFNRAVRDFANELSAAPPALTRRAETRTPVPESGGTRP